MNPVEPEELTNTQDQETGSDCPQFSSQFIPPNSANTQDGVHADDTMSGVRE